MRQLEEQQTNLLKVQEKERLLKENARTTSDLSHAEVEARVFHSGRSGMSDVAQPELITTRSLAQIPGQDELQQWYAEGVRTIHQGQAQLQEKRQSMSEQLRTHLEAVHQQRMGEQSVALQLSQQATEHGGKDAERQRRQRKQPMET